MTVLSIPSSYPLYDKNNGLLGVIGIDLILSQISDFLHTIIIDFEFDRLIMLVQQVISL